MAENRPGSPGNGFGAVPDPVPVSALAKVPGVLGTIARERAADYRSPAGTVAPAGREGRIGFGEALSGPGVAVIAEVKRASPSHGAFAGHDPLALARAYQRGGAAAISVLTESRHFDGTLGDLESVARAVPLPVLRKDFVVHPAQLEEAVDAGARAALLIAAVLGPRVREYRRYAEWLGIECLVEVHDEQELTIAMEAEARIVGVNNRDLRSLEIDLQVAPRLLRQARAWGYRGLTVAESGYTSAAQLEALDGLADAVLVGSSLAASADPARTLAQLRATSRGGAGRLFVRREGEPEP